MSLQQGSSPRPETTPSNARSNNTGGRGRGRGGRGNRSQGSVGQQSNSRFQGQEPTLKECTFDYSEDPQSRRYLQNVELLIGYVGSNFNRHNLQFQQALEDLELKDPDKPARPAEDADAITVEEWKMAHKAREDKLILYENFRAALYSLIWGQCTPLMKDKLQAKAKFADVKKTRDGLALLALIKETTFTFDSGRIYKLVGRDKLKEDFYCLRRRNNQSIHSYYEVFRAKVKVLKEAGVKLYDADLVPVVAAAHKREKAPTQEDIEETEERCIAIRFIRTCGNKEYESHLQNMFLDGHNSYPRTLADARAILDNRMTAKNKPKQSTGGSQPDNATGVAYMTHESDQGSNTSTITDSQASGAESGNHAHANSGGGEDSCCLLTHERVILPNFVFSSSHSQASVPKGWILLDNQSTVDVIHDRRLLQNIHTSDSPINIQSHAGKRQLTKKGLLPGYGLVWFDEQCPANILSLNNATTRFQVKYNSDDGNQFTLHDRSSGRLKHRFHRSPDGLYYMDSGSLQGSFLTTVSENEAGYSPDDVARAKAARSLLAKIGRPSTREYIKILKNNLLPNANVNEHDVRRAEKLYGPDLGTLKGKTTRRKPPRVDTSLIVPPTIAEEHKDVTIAIDVLHVNNVAFLATISRRIHFGTIEAIQNSNDSTLLHALRNTLSIYRRGGLRPRVILADGAFTSEYLKTQLQLMGVNLNPTARDEHVGDIERYIRTVKERMRCVYNTLPFDQIPKAMLIEMAKFSVFWLNSFPHSSGISQTESPRRIVTGESIDYRRHCRFEFGQYVQSHEQHDNTMAKRTVGAIALRPTGNRQGSYYFLSLDSGRIITRNHATPLPIPQEVIKRVHQLAQAQQMQPGLVFGNKDNRILAMGEDNPLYDEEDDDSYQSEAETEEDLRYDEELVDEELDAIVQDQVDEAEVNHGEQDADINLPLIKHAAGIQANAENQGVGQHEMDAADALDVANQGVGIDENDLYDNQNDESVIEDQNQAELEEEEEADETEEGALAGGEDEERGEDDGDSVPDDGDSGQDPNNNDNNNDNRYNLRPNRERSYRHRYGHSFACIDTLKHGRYDGYLRDGILFLIESEVNLSTPQMSMRKGVKLFGDKGVAAVKKEIQQLHDRGVLRAVHKTDLTWSQVQQALGYLMFLKRKRCGKIKGRGCADGRKQRTHIKKDESASPTVATEAVFITAVIDALERRVVTVADIPGAFMHSDMDPDVYMRIDGLMAELLLEVDRSAYEPYLTYEKNQPVIYVEMLKALYGTLRAARLFWEKLTAVLKSWNFAINPYDSCVANKIVNEKQLTVTWHIDDLKISHVDGQVVQQFVNDLKAEFGQLGEISVSEGSRHDYLGMFLDYGEDGVVQVDMRPYLDTVLDDLPKCFKGKARTPAAKHLYKTNEQAKKLNDEQAELYHSLTMQLAYVAQRGRPDIRMAVNFLSTRVANPDEDDYRKLGRVLKYLQSTRDLILRLEADADGKALWWADASYATHPDMKGQTGGYMTLGKGAVMTASNKQKLVARSSTECELIGVHDILPSIIWSKNFLEAQGYPLKEVVLHQDNQSSILLANNGRLSSSKRTKHINLRYFYVTDCIKRKEFRVAFCPTESMIADFFTKPLQGQAFYRLRDTIMNVLPSDPFHSSHRSVLKYKQETVGEVAAEKVKDQSATKDMDPENEGWILVRRRGSGKGTKTKQGEVHSKEIT